MLSCYRGRVGQYMWEKDKERLEGYNDRPWEFQSNAQSGGEVLGMAIVCVSLLSGLLLLSLF